MQIHHRAAPERVIEVEKSRRQVWWSKPSSSRISRATRTKIVMHIAYQLHFQCRTYALKAKKISFLVALVSCQNFLHVNENHGNKWISRIIKVLLLHLLGCRAVYGVKVY